MKAKFNVGDRVFYKARNRTGSIQSVINADDPQDVLLQGFRYEVKLSDGYVWSILEGNLRIKEKRKVAKNETAIAS